MPAKGKRSRPSGGTSTEACAERVAELAKKHWSLKAKSKKFDAKVVNDVYNDLKATDFPSATIAALEYSHYLEEFLWPNYVATKASTQHTMSIILMVNEKFLNQSEAWTSMVQSSEQFPQLLHTIMDLALGKEDLSMQEATSVVIFLIRCFQSLEEEMLYRQLTPWMGLNTWRCLLPARLEAEMKDYPKVRKSWKKMNKAYEAKSKSDKAIHDKQSTFVFDLTQRFLSVLATEPSDRPTIAFCERNLELLIDVQSLLSSRRYLNAVLDTTHVVELCTLSPLAQTQDGHLFRQLLDILKFYSGFEIKNYTGEPLTDTEMMQLHYDQITTLQKVAFKKFPKLKGLALTNVSNVDTRAALLKHFVALSDNELHELCHAVTMLGPLEGDTAHPRELLVEMLTFRFERRLSQLEALNEMPLFPTEQILWDENIVPTQFYADGCLALPKLNIQFLTLFDYLLRNLNLFNMESMYEIRQDIEFTIPRLQPIADDFGNTEFRGWARMAHPIKNFLIMEVAKPNVGEKKPGSVRADVTLDLSNVRPHLMREWEGLRKHDVGLLLTIVAPKQQTGVVDVELPFAQKYGIVTVRGCEIEGLLDVNGHLVERFPGARPALPQNKSRTFRVHLDTNQYQMDLAASAEGYVDIYETFNVFMRRNPKENNFKAILETIRELMNTHCVVPDWLHDIFLGYGDPGAAHYSKMSTQIATQDWNDTFLDFDHLKNSFPDLKLKPAKGDDMVPPFKLTFPIKTAKPLVPRNVAKKSAAAESAGDAAVIVESYKPVGQGPYPANRNRKNTIPFTPTQVEAIRAGMQPGLTMVVGPPGTGKTDVAVQIISNIYHNYPNQRTLIVTHSNQALNQLFEKIMGLDIEERHLLRLGRGEEDLDTDKSFSQFGRVDFVLQERLSLLREVQRLAATFPNVMGDVASTCETAGHFYSYHVLARWEKYLSEVKVDGAPSADDITALAAKFPFTQYFSNAPQPIFAGEAYETDLEAARGCMRHLDHIFERLQQYRPLELLPKAKDRSKYLMTKEAKIIAMTCTHAALTRHDLVKQGFKYDNILMEESAQILEIETFIPLLLQNPQDGFSRLKRVVLIGDHHQLPPVIQNVAFKKFSNMEQSLFKRFVRLGVPTVQLDAQGRARPSIASLYAWRYNNLGSLEHTKSLPEFTKANGGLQYDYQFIDVQDFEGRGESTPEPYFYQNLGEAEYVVGLYMYMRLRGYPAEKITILTTYNGQKALLRDVINARCVGNPLFGAPSKIETVDKFQGSQNDYVLLSLVRAKAVGHIRDVRRLVVAVSRARLGLYVFGRRALFEECRELKPVFDLLLSRPDKLCLYPAESQPCDRSAEDVKAKATQMKEMTELATLVYEEAKAAAAAAQQKHAPPSGPPPGMEVDDAANAGVPPGFPGFGFGDDDEEESVAPMDAPPGFEPDDDDEAATKDAAMAVDKASSGPIQLRFEFVDVEAEKAVLTNDGGGDVDLTGFTIQDLDGGNKSKPFPSGVVKAGKSVNIWTAPGTVKGLKQDADNLFWLNAGNGKPRNKNVLNDEGDGLKLCDASGNVIATGLGPAKKLHLTFDLVDVTGASFWSSHHSLMTCVDEKGILRNNGSEHVDLTGFTVEDLDGGNKSAPFVGGVVPAGKTCTIWVAPGTVRGLKADAQNVFWLNPGNGKPRSKNVLNDSGDGLKLRNPQGDVVATGLGAAAEPAEAPKSSRKRKAPTEEEEISEEKDSKKANLQPAQDWSKLTVAKLKAELTARGVSLKGMKRKADYVAKLEELSE